MSFQNKTVCITGASAGIGLATAKVFAKAGARLILIARRKEKLLALSDECKNAFGTESLVVELDIQNPHKVQAAFEQLPPDWRLIDVLVNNAGLALGLEKVQTLDLADVKTMLDTNVLGLISVTRAVLPGMIQQKSGHIIMLGSIAGHEVYSGGSVYCATKFAVNAFTRALKRDVLEHNIKVTSIDPGMVETGFSEVRFKGDKARAKKVYEGLTPLTPEDVAEAVFYAASRPPHVNISEIILMPTDQAGVGQVFRKS